MFLLAATAPAGGYAKALDDAVKEVKVNGKWRRDYMTLALKLQEREEVAALGKTVSVIRNGKGRGSDDFLMSVLGLSREQFAEISDMLDTYPGKSDWDIADAIING